MAAPSISVFSVCCFLMALLFALSATFQFNDAEWHLWFPLYAIACIVNLVNGLGTGTKIKDHLAKVALWLGAFLFIKVTSEDISLAIAGPCSLNMRERIVREMLGSGLVITSMSLHLNTSEANDNSIKGRNQKNPERSIYGMLILVATGYSLSIAFFAFQHREMEF